MAEGFRSSGTTPMGNKVLNCVFRNTALTGPATLYVQLHTGAPGAAGTTSVANTSASKRVATGSFAVAASGQVSNSADIVFTAVTVGNTYTHATIWDNPTGPSTGDFLISGALVGTSTTGNDFTINAGQLVISLNTAS